MNILETLKELLPSLKKAANEGKINPAEYLIAAALLLMAEDMDAIRKSLAQPGVISVGQIVKKAKGG